MKKFNNILKAFKLEIQQSIAENLIHVSKVIYETKSEIVYHCVVKLKIFKITYKKKNNKYEINLNTINEILNLIDELNLYYKNDKIKSICNKAATDIYNIFAYMSEIRHFAINNEPFLCYNFILKPSFIKYSIIKANKVIRYNLYFDKKLPYSLGIIKALNDSFGNIIQYTNLSKISIYDKNKFISQLMTLFNKN